MFDEVMSPEEKRAMLSDFVEVHELVRVHGGAWCRKEILPYLPVAASRGLLFAASNGSRIVGMMIAGPTNKPTGRDNFCAEGRLLFCYDWLVDPKYRDQAVMLEINRELKEQAYARFPHTEKFCYLHFDRYVEKKIRRGECASEEVAPKQSAMASPMPLPSSRKAMRDPSVGSRLPLSSTGS